MQRSAFIIGILLSLTLISGMALNQQWFLRADYLLFDWQAKQVAGRQTADKDIVVIAIDDFSLSAMDNIAGRWVWPRSVHAELIEGLAPFNPASIAFDILFAEPDIYRPDGDIYLNEVLAENTNIYFAILALDTSNNQTTPVNTIQQYLPLVDAPSEQAESGMLALPNAIDKTNWRLGTINYLAEIDGVSRYYALYQPSGNLRLYSMAASITRTMEVSLPAVERILLNWQSNQLQPYLTYSYSDVYQAVIENNEELLSQFTGKTVLVGATSAGLYDARATPINHNLPGVYVLATALDNLLNQAHFVQISLLVSFVITLLALLITASCFYFVASYSRQLISAILFAVGYSVFVCYLNSWLMTANSVMFIASPIILSCTAVLSFGFCFGYLEFLDRRKALSMFGRFLDPKVVLNLLSEGRLSSEHLNQKAELTVLFSDIRGFTQLSEQHDAKQVLALLNQYFERQVSVIFQANGTLDKFMGDCLMAFWGAPVANCQHAEQAISAALTMQDNLEAFKLTLPKHLQHFDIGIGIHSGEAIAGLVGTNQRVDYTVIGDTVNLASRIEGLTKNTCRILVSEQTMQLAKDKFNFNFQGEFTVKGRNAKVKLYQPLRR